MSNSRSTRVALVSVLVAVLVAGLLVAAGILGLSSPASADEQLFLEAVEDVGANPFAPAAGPKNPVSRPGGVPPGGVQPDGAPGVTLGCDAAALVSSLEGDVRLATAWTEALNTDVTLTWSGGTKVRPDQVRAYIAELAPQILSNDVRVTNFQYTKGSPTSVQSVLQTGSSVLIDKVGVVRVRCKCGNPLIPMKRLTVKPVYQGKPWPGFVDIDVLIVKRCGDDEYWNGKECRDIDCKDGYYYDGSACRPIRCDGDEKLRDGYCRPVKCDDDAGRPYDGRGCIAAACVDDEKVFDGNRCRSAECPKGEHAVGRDCQKPECDSGKRFDSDKGCVEERCPTGQHFTGSECGSDECSDGRQNTSDCIPACEAKFTWSAEKRMCEEQQTGLLQCDPGSDIPECADPARHGATEETGTTPPGTPPAGTPPAGTPGGPANPCPTNSQSAVSDPACGQPVGGPPGTPPVGTPGGPTETGPANPCPTDPLLDVSDPTCAQPVDTGTAGGESGTAGGQTDTSGGETGTSITTPAHDESTTPDDGPTAEPQDDGDDNAETGE